MEGRGNELKGKKSRTAPIRTFSSQSNLVVHSLFSFRTFSKIPQFPLLNRLLLPDIFNKTKRFAVEVVSCDQCCYLFPGFVATIFFDEAIKIYDDRSCVLINAHSGKVTLFD